MIQNLREWDSIILSSANMPLKRLTLASSCMFYLVEPVQKPDCHLKNLFSNDAIMQPHCYDACVKSYNMEGSWLLVEIHISFFASCGYGCPSFMC